MINSNKLDKVAEINDRSLKSLTRAIAMGKGKFSLIVVRCNYEILQEEIIKLVGQRCSGNIEYCVVPKSALSLYKSIKEYLGDKSPDALIVCGLESVKNKDIILQSANRLRDEFRNFTFPVALLLTDLGLKKLMQQAPDFNSFASAPICFSLPDEELKALIFRGVDGAANDADNFRIKRAEIEALRQDLARRDSSLDGETRACFAFLEAWDFAENKRIDAAVDKYRECLKFWQEDIAIIESMSQTIDPPLSPFLRGTLKEAPPLPRGAGGDRNIESDPLNNFDKNALRRGIVQLYLAQTYQENELARDYFEEAFNSFARANRRDLVATHISKLAALLQELKQWQSLEEIVIYRALPLHQDDAMKEREDRGFLAFAAIQQSKWPEAKARVQSALEALKKEDSNVALPRYWSLYFFILALAKLQLNEVKNGLDSLKKAFSYLEAAREENLSESDAKLLLKIIEPLQISLKEKRQYLEAFNCKLIVREIKSQYGWIAFIGAGRLQPSLKVINAEEKTPEEKSNIRRKIMAASGRQPDLERLIERIKNTGRKLTVIYGKSGVGKSSLLQAGLVPVMELDNFDERDYLPVLLRRYQSWDRELINELNKNHESLEECLEYFQQQRHCLIVLIFDQFEEFFFDNPDAGTREKFYRFLRQCLEIDYLKVVFSLREDYLHDFFEPLRGYIDSKIDTGYGDIFYYLGDLKPEDAREIIESLTARSPVPLKFDLISQLVEDLAGELEGVRPIELQIVGSQLETAKIATLRKYKKLGERPKEILVTQFLEDAVKDCGEENQKAAELVLFLLTTENTRPLKTARELKEDLESLEVKEEKLDLVLKVLVGSGLVLLVPETPEDFYQLVHDYLVEFIRRKYEPQSLELQREKEQRRREEKKRRRAERGLLLVSIAACVVMTAFGVQAQRQRREAIKESIIASANEAQALMLSNRSFDARLAALKAGRQTLDHQPTQLTDDFSVVIDSLGETAYKTEDQLFRESNRLAGHKGLVYDASFSPDGELIATASYDNTVKLWSRDGEELQTLRGHEGRVYTVSFSPDGKLIATASYDNTVKLWSREGKLLQTLRGHEKPVRGVSFSPDGKLIASASYDNTVKLWSREGKLLQTLRGHEGSVWGVSFSPDGELIASASEDETIKLWSREGKELRTLRGHEDWILSVSFSPNGRLIASTSSDNTVKLWSRDGEELQTLRGHESMAYDVSFSPDGELIASAGYDKTVKLWSRDGKRLQILKGHQGRVQGVRFSPDGNLIATASDDATVKLWSRDSKKLRTLRGHEDWVNDVKFSPDGNLIATGSDDKTVKLWNRDGKELQTLRGHTDWVFGVSFSPDGELIATASRDHTVKLWNRDGKELRALSGHNDSVTRVSFSPDGELIATASRDQTVKLWSKNGQLRETLEGHSDWVHAVSFSPGGELIASASDDKTLKLWSRDGKQLQSLRGHKGGVNAVSFSPDGKLIASASDDKTVKLWSRDGKELQTLRGHQGRIWGVSFSPDGEFIASTSKDNTLKLWSRDGKLLQTFRGHQAGLWGVSFSPDGKSIATASGDKSVILWEILDFNELMKLNCQLVGDYLRNNQEVEDSDRGLCDGVEE
ncbi:MAG: hypothetical protein SXA11_06700 [Cyanobacteriota bacterium]|nr:hypothetical protein [Cyanobacteriota bacterium]